jgi:hypothetical protein
MIMAMAFPFGPCGYATLFYSTGVAESPYRNPAGGFLAAKHFVRIDPQKKIS